MFLLLLTFHLCLLFLAEIGFHKIPIGVRKVFFIIWMNWPFKFQRSVCTKVTLNGRKITNISYHSMSKGRTQDTVKLPARQAGDKNDANNIIHSLLCHFTFSSVWLQIQSSVLMLHCISGEIVVTHINKQTLRRCFPSPRCSPWVGLTVFDIWATGWWQTVLERHSSEPPSRGDDMQLDPQLLPTNNSYC